MKDVDIEECETHILVCTNERPPGKPCCHKAGGLEFYQKLKNKLKETGLNKHNWASRSGCLGYCNDVGTTVAIHRKGEESQWFTEVTGADFEKIWTLATE